MTPDHYKPNDEVRYVPMHARGDLSHPHCEDGRVTSINKQFVFVRFKEGIKACPPERLVRL